MGNDIGITELIEVVFTVTGNRRPDSVGVGPATTVAEFVSLVARKHGVAESLDLFLEDAEGPLPGDVILVEHLAGEFAPLHVGHRPKVKVKVEYRIGHHDREFSRATTILRITEWAISPQAFGLEGTAADYDLKHDGKVVSPDTHLGQVAHGAKEVTFALVFKEKPQG